MSPIVIRLDGTAKKPRTLDSSKNMGRPSGGAAYSFFFHAS